MMVHFYTQKYNKKPTQNGTNVNVELKLCFFMVIENIHDTLPHHPRPPHSSEERAYQNGWTTVTTFISCDAFRVEDNYP